MTDEQATHKIDELRSAIDELDLQIFSLLSERLLLAADIGRVKKAHNITVIDSERESSLIQNLGRQFKEKLSRDQIETMVTTLLKLSHDVQAAV